MINKKKFWTILFATSILVSNTLITKAAENTIHLENDYTYTNILGVYREGNTSEKIVKSKEDMNYILDNLDLNFDNDTLTISVNLEGQQIDFQTVLYPSQLGNNTENKILGIINNSGNSTYDILKLTIEKNADSSSLLVPNFYMEGNTVLSFALYNKFTLEEYYFQFPLEEDFNFDIVYTNATNNLMANPSVSDDVMDTEISYFTLQPKTEFKKTFKAINEITMGKETTTSSNNTMIEEIEDLKGQSIDELINISKEEAISLSNQTYSLIPNIPDSLYKVQQNGTWSNGDTGFDSSGNLVGYTIYHMNDSYSGNALNYVLRYYVSSRFNWSSNEFETSFNLSHNIWVQYIKSSNLVYVFDDRASNARILMSPEINMKINTAKDSDGYFVSRMTNANKNGSKANNIAQLIIGYVPYLSDVNNIYQTLTSDTATGNNSKTWFESSYTKEVKAKINNLKYAPNDKGYSQDYIGMTIWGNNVNSVNHGYNWTCKTK